MNKKIKVIDLLVKIAKGEEVPTKIQYGYDKNNCCAIWILNPSLKDYSCNERNVGDNQLFRDYIGDITVVLNNEVKVLEDNTEEIEELDKQKAKNEIWTYTDANINKSNLYCLSLYTEHHIVPKINELVRAVNKLRKDKSND